MDRKQATSELLTQFQLVNTLNTPVIHKKQAAFNTSEELDIDDCPQRLREANRDTKGKKTGSLWRVLPLVFNHKESLQSNK